MNWLIDFSEQSVKFCKKNSISSDKISELIVKAIKKLRGENINIEIAKLSGSWRGFYKIRTGKIRIIAAFDFDNQKVRVEIIDWRGNAYKK